jgi:hypothetical protein
MYAKTRPCINSRSDFTRLVGFIDNPPVIFEITAYCIGHAHISSCPAKGKNTNCGWLLVVPVDSLKLTGRFL